MNAVFISRHGGPEVLEYGEQPTPEPGRGELRIRVKACALNHLDIWVRQGLPGVEIPLPHILGSDIAGVVDKLGRGVTHPLVGTPVIITPGIGCGKCRHCASGWTSLCNQFTIMGFRRDGGYAEYAVAGAKSAIPVSSRYSFEEWAAVPLVFLTVYHMLVTRAGLKKGETVLVHAAGSGIGSAAIQLARHLGAKVITTAGTDEKLEKAKRLGAQGLVNYKRTDFVEEVKRFTKGKGVDVVFEHIGPATWMGSLASLAKGGRLVTCGATSGPKTEIDLRFLFMKQLSILGSYMGGDGELRKVLRLVSQGKLKPVVDSILPLSEARKAHERMESRDLFGKIVLTLP